MYSKILYSFVVLLALSTGNMVRAETALQDAVTPYPAPAIAGIEHWINSPPLTMDALKGKVVLVDFWTYSCINCVRTLPHIKEWDAKYRDKGLVILGIHAPEFEFEKNLDNVKKAVAKYGISYPVALDNHLATWSNFNNQYWPAHYLINKEGQVVYTHFGEGKYEVTEHNIRVLLGLDAEKSVSAEHSETSENQSPETYLGYARAKNFAGVSPLIHDSAADYAFPAELPANNWALRGKWRVEGEKIVSVDINAALRFNFTAGKVFLVLGTEKASPIDVTVSVNGVQKNTLIVTNHALYTLVSQEKSTNGVLELKAAQSGLEAYAFTFGQ